MDATIILDCRKLGLVARVALAWRALTGRRARVATRFAWWSVIYEGEDQQR